MQQQQMTEWEAYQAVRSVKTDEHGLLSAESQASGNTAADMAALLKQMNSLSRTTRERAVRAANALPPGQLLTLVQTGANFYRTRKRRSAYIILAPILGWFPACLVLFVVSNLSTAAIMLSFWPLVNWLMGWSLLYVPFRLSWSLVTQLRTTERCQPVRPGHFHVR